MAYHHVLIELGQGTGNLRDVHIHFGCDDDRLDGIMAGIEELQAAVSGVTTAVGSVLTNTTELVKDVKRLLENNDTAGAIATLATVQTNLEDAGAKLAEADAAVEASSPEPTTPAPAPDENPFG